MFSDINFHSKSRQIKPCYVSFLLWKHKYIQNRNLLIDVLSVSLLSEIVKIPNTSPAIPAGPTSS